MCRNYVVFFALIALFCSLTVEAQVSVIPNPTDNLVFSPSQLSNQSLFSDQVVITDVQYAGDSSSFGSFTADPNTFGLDMGLVMSTGKLKRDGPTDLDFGLVDGATETSQTDLQATVTYAPLQGLNAGATLEDVSFLEVTFIPQTDSISVDLVFASENYSEAPCNGNLPDIMGVFLEGNNPDGGVYNTENIATVGTANDLVNSTTIFDDTSVAGCAGNSSNPTLYVDNAAGGDFIFDGYTRMLSFKRSVVPCQSYTIVFAIADVSDFDFDSAIFFQVRNKLSNSLTISKTSTSNNSLYLSETCQDTGYIVFDFANPLAEDQLCNVQIIPTGTATPADIESIINPIEIPAGATRFSVPVVPVNDGLGDDLESLVLEVRSVGGSFEGISSLFCQPDTLEFLLRDSILAIEPLPTDTTICQSNTLDLRASLTGNALLQGSTRQQREENIFIGALGDTEFTYTSVITVSDQTATKLGDGVLSQVCIDALDHNFRQDLDIYLQAPGGGILELTTDNGGNGTGDTERFEDLCFSVDATTRIHRGRPVEGEPYLLEDTLSGSFLPEGEWEDLWSIPSSVNGEWRLIIIDDEPNTGIGQFFSWSMVFMPAYMVDYTWEPSGLFTNNTFAAVTFEPTTTGIQEIDLLVTDNFGCQINRTVNVDVRPDASISGLSCADSTENTILFTWDNQPAVDSYEVKIEGSPWTRIGNVDSFLVDNLLPGEDYDFIIRVAEPCVSEADTLTCGTLNCAARGVSMSLTAPLSSCPGQATGVIEIQNTTSNPFPPFKYTWSNDSTLDSNLNENLAKGTYMVTLEDADGCSDMLTLEINEMALDSIGIAPASCAYVEDAEVTLVAENGNGLYSYDFGEGFQASNVNSALAAGADTFFIRDQTGCEIAVPAIIPSEREEIAVTGIRRTEPSCYGVNDGTIEILFSPNNHSPYTFQWFSLEPDTIPFLFENSNIFQSAEVGAKYGFSILDSGFCLRPIQEVVTLNSQPDSLMANVTLEKEISCFEGDDAILGVEVTGGTPEYTYEWNDGSTSSTLNNVLRGFYSVTITDENACEAVASITNEAFLFPNELTVNFPNNSTKSQITCLNNTSPVTFEPVVDGGIPFRVPGNDKAYNYTWSRPDGTIASNLKNLSAFSQDTGWYQLVVTDGRGCTVADSVLVEAYPEMQIEVDTTNNSCFGQQEGAISVQVMIDGVDETDNTRLRWTNLANTGYPEGESAAQIGNLSAGFYRLTSTDQNNCQTSTTIPIREPIEIMANATVTNETCDQRADGSIVLAPSGGVPTYTYSWSVPGVSQDNDFISSLSLGNYTVTITDQNACEKVDSFVINAGDNLRLESLVVDNKCFGDEEGSVSLSVRGQKDSYGFEWQNGSDSSAITGLKAGRFFVTISDNDDCNYNFDFEVKQPDSIVISKDIMDVVCYNGEDGQISYFTDGGTAPYTYSLNGGLFTRNNSFIGLNSGEYVMIMRDENSCESAADTTIFENPPQILFDDRALDTIVDQFEEVLFRYPFADLNNNYIVTWQDLGNPDDNGRVTYDTTLLVEKGTQLQITVQDITTGCQESDVIDINIIRNHQLYVPTGFSPNDDQKNDLLVVHGRPGTKVLSFNIYDRWGELIYANQEFDTNDFTTGWDGTFKDQEMDSGLYLWTAEVLFQDGTTSLFKGKTRLFR